MRGLTPHPCGRRQRYAESMRMAHGSITDALSGNSLDVFEQLVTVTALPAGKRAEQPTSVNDARLLHGWLEALHDKRCTGSTALMPTAALLTAGPAAGKTVRVLALARSSAAEQPPW